MAIHRYWRLTGFVTLGNAALDLSEARIYEAGSLADASATLIATIAPASGAVADLRDGVATGVVSWPYASYSAASFALVWDFGAGLGVDMAQLSFGAGSVVDNFVMDLTLQYSDDAIVWTNFGSRSGITWPGSLTMTAAPALGDPYFSNVKLLMRAVGIPGGKIITDASESAKTIVIVGLPQLSSVQSAFSGDVSILVNPNFNSDQNQYLYVPVFSDFALAGDFTIEVKLFPVSFGATWGSFLVSTINSAFASGTGFVLNYGYAPNANKVQFSVNGVGINSNAAPVLNEWSDIAITRISGVISMFVRGVLQTETVTNSAAVGVTNFIIGISSNSANTTGVNGYFDELRITDVVGRHSATYTPSTTRFPTRLNSPPAVAKHRANAAQATSRMLPAIAPPDGAARSHLRETPFFDAQFGGTGTIIGTAKEKALPDNTPLHRRVLLMDQRSQVVFRETWSDAVTGAYTFPGVKTNTPHTVLAYDYTGTYRAVIADNILATP